MCKAIGFTREEKNKMQKYINLKDIKGNKLYVGNTVEFKRNNVLETGTIIDKSHQFSGIYFIQPNKGQLLVLLNEYYIPIFQIKRIK